MYAHPIMNIDKDSTHFLDQSVQKVKVTIRMYIKSIRFRQPHLIKLSIFSFLTSGVMTDNESRSILGFVVFAATRSL
jgi:hypothetical protein